MMSENPHELVESVSNFSNESVPDSEWGIQGFDPRERGSRIHEVLISAIDKQYKDETPDRALKLELISKISENLVEEFDGFLRAEQINTMVYAEFVGKPPGEFNEDVRLRGELFERLVSVEYVSDPPEIGAEILALLHSPDRFNFLHELGYVRNPDLAVVEMNNEGNLTILQAGDAKLGRFNYRMYKQFMESGFKSSMEEMATVVNSCNNLDEHGLPVLQGVRDNKNKIEVAKDYTQYVIVPKDRDVGNPESVIDRRSFHRQADFDAFAQMLKGGEINVILSSFTGEEIFAMSEVIKTLIDERRKLQANSDQ